LRQLKDLAEVVVRELVSTQHSISDEELARARTQLQSMLLMNLESRPIVFEDVGRQVLANSHRHTPQYYYELIGELLAVGMLALFTMRCCASAAFAVIVRLSATSRYCIETIGRIELVFGVEAFFHLSYTVL